MGRIGLKPGVCGGAGQRPGFPDVGMSALQGVSSKQLQSTVLAVTAPREDLEEGVVYMCVGYGCGMGVHVCLSGEG